MKKILKLQQQIEILQEISTKGINGAPVQYWSGGDWQKQGIEYVYSKVLKMIEKIINE